jgi:hypothetical protein
MLIGMRLTFRDDGTGIMDEWGFDHFHLDPTYVIEPIFKWRPISERKTEITHRGAALLVSYDFKITRDAYGIKELRMFDPEQKPNDGDEIGFWISPFSLVYYGQEKPKGALGIILRLWKTLRAPDVSKLLL